MDGDEPASKVDRELDKARMHNELGPLPEMNPTSLHDSSAAASKLDRWTPSEDLTDLLGHNSARDLLVILMDQMLKTRTEVRVLQATVNTLLIELCHRQPDKLGRSLARMSAQRRQEVLTEFRQAQPIRTED